VVAKAKQNFKVHLRSSRSVRTMEDGSSSYHARITRFSRSDSIRDVTFCAVGRSMELVTRKSNAACHGQSLRLLGDKSCRRYRVQVAAKVPECPDGTGNSTDSTMSCERERERERERRFGDLPVRHGGHALVLVTRACSRSSDRSSCR